MKYSIMGFDQKTVIDINEQGHKIDVNDLLILRWLVDFSHTDKMAKLSIGSNTYYWVSYQAVLNDLPLLKIGRRMLAVRLKKMVDAGILTSYLQKSGGTFTMYGFGKRFQSLISSDNKEEQDSGNKLAGGDNKFTGGCQNIYTRGDNKFTPGVPMDLHPKDPSTKHPSTSDESTNTDSCAEPKNVPATGTKKPRKSKAQAAEIPTVEELTERFDNSKLAAVVCSWFEYKRERGDKPYTPMGMKSFLTTVERFVKNKGVRGVCQCIELTMGSGYQGVLWDKCEDTR